jgi:hypothetical protein
MSGSKIWFKCNLSTATILSRSRQGAENVGMAVCGHHVEIGCYFAILDRCYRASGDGRILRDAISRVVKELVPRKIKST